MTTFSATLSRMRTTAGLSQSALSRHAGTDVSTVNRLESGHRHPSRDLVGRLADGLALGPYQRVELFHAAGYLAPGMTYTVETGQAVTVVVEGRDGKLEAA